MDLRLTCEEIAFRDEIRAFFKNELPADLRRKVSLGRRLSKAELVGWHHILHARGWAAPTWPKEWGGPDWSAVQLYIFTEELLQAPAPPIHPQGASQLGSVLIAMGSDAQKKQFLPYLPNLDIFACQGFSEPGAGSDLASLKTRAVRDGDHYVVNGQKLWTSVAHWADWMYALVRTDPAVKKQKGITYLMINMRSPGLTVKPVITLDGAHHTNETFFDNVRVPLENRIGEENKGWDYAKYLLGHERVTIARVGQSKGRVKRAKELAARVMLDDKPLSEEPRFREKLAALEVELKALEITNMRIVDRAMKNPGAKPDPKSSILKLKGSELQQATLEVLFEVAGPLAIPRQTEYLEGETEETVGPDWAATSAQNYYFGRAVSIFGGSNEIQHNIIAKAVLGL